ncbi:hypothetical protein GCM10010387_15610 [Streptomyces inusitatus]|uniref:Phage head morphogenesis domain-containing protein n=1 Tax=Streptomyces inusitatus TaxID=68221 RepID=A0A918UNT5_9ACTN|nr:phage minor head protein [Streptomyces inusitatus]GGZ23351.1 hypothetical protein GCM10010387_15610 [Streptomyces inusitatus]
MPDRDSQITQAEETVAAAVAEALTATADEFADAVRDATELVAARFSVGRIGRMWGARISGLVRRFLGVAETAAEVTAEDLDTELPEGWDNLPGRYDDGRPLPDGIGRYVETTEHLLRAVGDRLAEAARRELAAGVDAGEDVDQLRARLRDAFSREGAQLGPGREERIGMTESTRAWNTATLAAAQALSGPDRPLVKQWVTRHDDRVRSAHDQVDGQLQLLADPFVVGGVPMQAPGDPTAPPELVINCRCRLTVAPENRASAYEPKDPVRGHVFESEESSVETADTVTAAGDGHTGAMIALVPCPEDIERLALAAPGATPADELHLTLFYLGEAADWSAEQRSGLIDCLLDQGEGHGLGDDPIYGRAFGANQWNADRDEPCWVWSVGDDPDRPPDAPTLSSAHWTAVHALEDMHDQPALPAQHTPWQPHVCAAYSRDETLLTALNDRLGPIRFDRLRVGFAGDYTDIPLGLPPVEDDHPVRAPEMTARAWSTPGDAALAFENTETGDGRVFAPGALYWDSGPWPLQYADEMLSGHQGAELAGAIQTVGRDGDRIPGTGVLYTNRPAGADALMLLEEGAPLGVSVDLDDVSVEFVNRADPDDGELDDVQAVASLSSASLMRLNDGAWALTATTAGDWTASGVALSRAATTVQLITGPDGSLPAAAVHAAFAGTGALTAAAGDPDDTSRGTVVHRENSGDLLLRVTRARLRGATLVAMPAYDKARIVLDDPGEEQTASAAGPSDAHMHVVRYVQSAPVAVGAREIARALGMRMETVRGHLTRAARAGRIIRLAPGLYVGAGSTLPEGVLAAAMSGDLDLPVHDDPDTPWDGDAAKSKVLAWATGDDDVVDAAKLGAAFLYRDPEADPATLAAYKLGFADVFDGELHIVAHAVYAIAGVLDGAMGGVDLPPEDREEIHDRVEELYERLAEAYDDPSIRPPWDDEDADDEMTASAWTAMRDLPPMPAAWFREPTAAELPPGSGGVHYAAGRIYGWVARKGEPHAGMPGKVTLESLGRIDLSHFLRTRFELDDGRTVRTGAFTMNVGHHRDGAECETSACQFDDTRTVAGIVTVGINSGGMWFSGAAAPWLSEWDRRVFQDCQPSYHMRKRGGRYELRAVLSVPVPAHSSPLLASTVTERSNLALAASAAVALDTPDTLSAPVPRFGADLPGHRPDSPDTGVRTLSGMGEVMSDQSLDTLLAALSRRQDQHEAEARAELERLTAWSIGPARLALAASGTPTRGGV